MAGCKIIHSRTQCFASTGMSGKCPMQEANQLVGTRLVHIDFFFFSARDLPFNNPELSKLPEEGRQENKHFYHFGFE